MVHLLIFMMISFIFLDKSVLTITVRKFVYQKDMSEYCRRRVVPSVFLGRQVMEAHSQILHFSKLDLPYSCFISVRAQSGSNVVLVVQLLSDESLVNACAEHPSQLLVYEMGETFGGYWGPLPESVLRPEQTEPEVYTMKTTKQTVQQEEAMEPLTSIEPHLKAVATTTTNLEPAKKEEDFIRIEVPIVNVSGRLVPGGNQFESNYDIDDIFDFLYDVTPRAKQQYRTKILPVVQFSIDTQRGGRRGGNVGYNIDLLGYEDGEQTTDASLTFLARTTRRQTSRTNFYINKLLNFKKIRTAHRSTKHSPEYFRMSTQISSSTDLEPVMHNKLTDVNLYKSQSTSSDIKNITTWEAIEEILRKLNKSSSYKNKYDPERKNITRLLDTISSIKNNRSVYLLPNWNTFIDEIQRNNQANGITKRFRAFTRKPLSTLNYALKNIKQFQKSTKSITQDGLLVATSEPTTNREIKYSSKDEVNRRTVGHKHTSIISTSNKNNITGKKIIQNTAPTTPILSETITVNKMAENTTFETISTHLTKPIQVSLVDHESWENVVKAAPVMAEMLNQTVPDTRVNDTRNYSSGIRIKRKIQPIPIDNARPHNLTTRAITVTTASTSYDIQDIQEFAQLVELEDDEIHGRIALRYLRQYAGPVLFNICDYAEPNVKHVYLFNSSRIVLAIQNFTLDRMSVMLTPARTLLSGEARCAESTLECQVYGTRICIDSMNACDGVPNCGTYDIYDEDRLMCGGAAGLQHNVYLAAITFLAVLLTLIYTVHYWLRRCVPKVSRAFFIYTDGAENILYLESIMRSPHDIYSGPQMRYHTQLFDDDDYMDVDEVKKHHYNLITRIIKGCFQCFKRKVKVKKLSDEFTNELPFMGAKKLYSFAELELSKMISQENVADASVQTGDSLEMSQRGLKKKIPFPVKSSPMQITNNRRMAKVAIASASTEDDIHQFSELNMLKFFKEFKSDHSHSLSLVNAKVEGTDMVGKLVTKHSIDEEELQTHFYDHTAHNMPETSHRVITTTCDIHPERPKTSKQAKKHLRFEEEATTIPSLIKEDDEEDCDDITEDRKNKDHDVEKADSVGGARDFTRFWKSKKSKKKTHLALH